MFLLPVGADSGIIKSYVIVSTCDFVRMTITPKRHSLPVLAALEFHVGEFEVSGSAASIADGPPSSSIK